MKKYLTLRMGGEGVLVPFILDLLVCSLHCLRSYSNK